MDAAMIGDLLEKTLSVTFYMSAPVLFVGLIIGVLISIVQAATQVNEVTLVFIPKMLGAGLALWLSGPWMVGQLQMLFEEIVFNLGKVGG